MVHSTRRHEGYLLNDQRASGGALVESATITCSHCHAIVVLNPDRSRARHHCAHCDHYLCDGCALIQRVAGGACRTLNQRLDTLQNAAVHQIGKG